MFIGCLNDVKIENNDKYWPYFPSQTYRKGTHGKKLILKPCHVTKIQSIRSYAKIQTNLGLSPLLVHFGILADISTKSGVPTPKFQNHLKGDFRPILAFFN